MSKTQTITELTRTNRDYFSDFFTDFGINAVTGELKRKRNEDSVKQSVRNLLLTQFGERLFQPRVGSRLSSMLFELADATTKTLLEESVWEVISNHEPRAELQAVNATVQPDNHTLAVTVIFRVINSDEPTTLTVTLERTR